MQIEKNLAFTREEPNAISETLPITDDGHEVSTHFEPHKLIVI